ncbi:MAG: cation diffusion facilitator family transporter [Salinirussus sp.]
MASSRSVVLAAFFANGAIAVLKFIGYLLTASPAMLSETYHSISDTGNQVFLLIGLRYDERARTREHPFGYGKAQFFYSFLVSVLLFGIAGWESAKHGYNAILHPHARELADPSLFGYTFPGIWVNYAVLIGAIIFEAWALKKAHANMAAQIEERGWSGFREAFRKTSDVTVLTALTEDTIAMAGAGLALLGIWLTRQTGNPLFDATAALLIGLLLMGFAIALAWENKRLLLGESLPQVEENQLREIVRNWNGVELLLDFRTVYFGPENVVLAADVRFDDSLTAAELDETIDAIEAAIRDANPDVTRVYIEPD